MWHGRPKILLGPFKQFENMIIEYARSMIYLRLKYLARYELKGAPTTYESDESRNTTPIFS